MGVAASCSRQAGPSEALLEAPSPAGEGRRAGRKLHGSRGVGWQPKPVDVGHRQVDSMRPEYAQALGEAGAVDADTLFDVAWPQLLKGREGRSAGDVGGAAEAVMHAARYRKGPERFRGAARDATATHPIRPSTLEAGDTTSTSVLPRGVDHPRR